MTQNKNLLLFVPRIQIQNCRSRFTSACIYYFVRIKLSKTDGKTFKIYFSHFFPFFFPTNSFSPCLRAGMILHFTLFLFLFCFIMLLPSSLFLSSSCKFLCSTGCQVLLGHGVVPMDSQKSSVKLLPSR